MGRTVNLTAKYIYFENSGLYIPSSLLFQKSRLWFPWRFFTTINIPIAHIRKSKSQRG